MFGIRRTRILKSSLAVVFLGVLALPVYLEKRVEETSTADAEIDTLAALGQFGFYLEEVSGPSNARFEHLSPRLDPLFDPILPQIASMGASVSVTDFDRDGWNDFYVTNSRFGSRNALFHNKRDGSFEEVAESMGLADLNQKGTGVCMGAIWADYDNDGYEDLFLYKWGRPLLFRNENGTGFKDVTENSGLPAWVNANSAIWFDYNSDGYVDLFIGGYFPEDLNLWKLDHTTVLTESFEYSMNGGRNYLLKNLGNGSFSDVSKEAGITSTRWTLAAGAADMNGDGFPELVIANDYGIDEFYFNEEGERFRESGEESAIGFSPKSGMNVALGDTYNQGHFGIYISNITEEGVLLQGNNFWVPEKGDGKQLVYRNLARQHGIESGGWSYGAQFGDLNNDGYQDLYVANGFISGKPGTSYWYDYSKVTGGNRAIISDISKWPAMEGRSQSGYQQNRIWINTGNGFFYDVADKVAGNQTFDSRSVAMADLWNRGVLDVIVANQNDRLVLYKNHVDPGRHWISFELRGTDDNRSAIGAIVSLWWDSQVQSQVISGGIGFSSQNQRRAQFGLGNASGVDSVEVNWPDGSRQVVLQPEINKLHTITEKL
jgi:hypothetical protein